MLRARKREKFFNKAKNNKQKSLEKGIDDIAVRLDLDLKEVPYIQDEGIPPNDIIRLNPQLHLFTEEQQHELV